MVGRLWIGRWLEVNGRVREMKGNGKEGRMGGRSGDGKHLGVAYCFADLCT